MPAGLLKEASVLIPALLVAGIAAVCDWRSRRIPNWLTVSSVFIGFGISAGSSGWLGAKMSLQGIGLALGVLLPFVLLKGLGAGDWKLMGAVGAFLGPMLFLFVMVGSIFASGIMAVIQMYRVGRVIETLRNMWTLVKGFAAFGIKKNPQISLDNPRLLKLPFGVAVAAATIVCCCAAYWPV